MTKAHPTKVLFLNSCINGGGAGRSLETILNVADTRVEAIVAMPSPGVLADRINGVAELVYVPEFVERMLRSPYVWPDRLRMPWLHLPANVYALARCINKLTRLVREIKPDVIHCNHMLAKPIGVAVGARTGIPVVFHSRACHQLWIDGQIYDWLGQREQVRRIICNSEASAQVYRRHCSDKVIIIPNGIDLDQYNQQAVAANLRDNFNIASDDFVVGFVGRIQASKGIEWLLHAFAAFSQRQVNAKLAIVGGNDSSLSHDALGDYQRDADALGLRNKVIFTGFQDDIRPSIKDFDVLVMPSILPESFGRVLLEAMAFEIPVIASAHGGALEVVRDGKEGLWVEVNNIDGLANAIETLYKDQSLRRRMGENGRRRVLACYDRVATARQVYDVLIEAATEQAPRNVA